MRKSSLVIFLSCAFAALAPGQSAPGGVVQARMLLSTDSARAGSTVKAAVIAQIAAGYHINDHKPSLDYLIPTELEIQPGDPVKVENVVYPKGTPTKFGFSDAPLSVYEGTLVIGALLKVVPGARPGAYTLKGKLDYQACNDHACLAPTSVAVALIVKVVPRSAPVKPVNADVFNRVSFN